jgi:hypothetical protein
MKRWGFDRLGKGHGAHASRTLDKWRGLLRGRVESTRCPEAALRPSRYKIVKLMQVDLTTDVAPKCLDVLRTHAIAEAHHVVRRWLVKDILKPVDRHICDVSPVHKGLFIFDEPLKDPAVPRCRHAAILSSICAPDAQESAQAPIRPDQPASRKGDFLRPRKARRMPPGLLTRFFPPRRLSTAGRGIPPC